MNLHGMQHLNCSTDSRVLQPSHTSLLQMTGSLSVTCAVHKQEMKYLLNKITYIKHPATHMAQNKIQITESPLSQRKNRFSLQLCSPESPNLVMVKGGGVRDCCVFAKSWRKAYDECEVYLLSLFITIPVLK